MNWYYAYVRVSTAKQGEKGVSLQEQRSAITGYAARHGLTIKEWFEERETAAKRGRPAFNQIVSLLRDSKARGLIIHKIDRSARNLRDWADLGELIDTGVRVCFANESLDLTSRGGRLSADIQAVVAADYIRNLREETRKGFYGRLKQGLYPLPAPTGYSDCGKGKPKSIDPIMGPIVRRAFELYATCDYSLVSLREELIRLGLRNRNRNPLTKSGIADLLHNPFYIGVIRLKRTEEVFAGVHEPLLSKSLYDRVQLVLYGKAARRTQRNSFMFRRLLRCKNCGYVLSGERQKGYIYYRCHTRTCPKACVREDAVERALFESLQPAEFPPHQYILLEKKVQDMRRDFAVERAYQIKALELALSRVKMRLSGLVDAYSEGVIERDLFEERKQALLLERKDIEEKITEGETNPELAFGRMQKFFELAKGLRNLYISARQPEKRDLIQEVTSNRTIDGKHVAITLSPAFQILAERHSYQNSGPFRDDLRSGGNMQDGITNIEQDHFTTLLLKLYRLLGK